MDFDTEKKEYMDALFKPDKSKKGSVDKKMVSLIQIINTHPDLVTTSSCSGRINIFTSEKSTKKLGAKWLIVTHEKANVDDFWSVLVDEIPQTITWFKQESNILHILARDFQTAESFMYFAQAHGFKHTQIIASKKRFILELVGTERISAPIAIDGELLLSKETLSKWITLANQKLDATHKKLVEFEHAFKTKFLES